MAVCLKNFARGRAGRIRRQRTVEHLAPARDGEGANSVGWEFVDDEPVGTPDGALEWKETWSSIKEALSTLAPREREVLEITYVRRTPLEHDEDAARALGVSTATIRVYRHRALKKVKASVARRLGYE